jgi:CBS domain-containing protein
MLMKDVYTPDVVCCSVQASALDAATLMREHHVGDVVVVDNEDEERTPLGIVTDRDLAVKVVAGGLDPSTTRVATLMHTPVVIAQASEDSVPVLERMRTHGVRRVPVVNGEGVVVGIVTLDDILRMIVTDAAGLVEVVDKGAKSERRALR